MEDKPGGTAHASAKLKSQLAEVESETALARTFIGKISAGYVQETGPIVIAKLQGEKVVSFVYGKKINKEASPANEEVRAHNDTLRHTRVSTDNPNSYTNPI